MRKMVISLLMLLGALLPAAGQHTDKRQAQAKKDRLQQEISILEKQLAANAKQKNTETKQLQLLQAQIGARRELLQQSERELRVIQDSIYANQKRINRLQERLDTLTLYAEKLIRGAYKNRDARVWYMYILASDNVSQALQRFGYLRNLSGQMSAQAVRIREARALLEVQQQRMAVLREEAARVRDTRRGEVEKLQREEHRALELVNTLDKNKKKYQKQLAGKQKEIRSLEAQLRRRAENEAKNARKKGKAPPEDIKLSRTFEDNKGKLPWPVEGRVVVQFSKPGKYGLNNTVGINIATAPGAEVCAVFDGVVVQKGITGHDVFVLIRHGGYYTLYSKLTNLDEAVKVGQKIATGQRIARVATVENDTWLLFGIWKGSKPQNPEPWLRKP
ncbi:MAG: peptidoglycan DD-metalloendopeptidase family protein [Bacteroidales bacterium]|nr:peptidoglycan DD-metalloendopeptidase family protein [Bacteroidales bacterium]